MPEKKSSPKFQFGAVMRISSDEGVIIDKVLENSAAEAGGLVSGDKLLAVNGNSLEENPLEVLGAAIEKGKTFSLEYNRDGERHTTNVTPKPIDESSRN